MLLVLVSFVITTMAETNTTEVDRKHKKTKKKDYISKAKKEGKQGNYGKGVELKEDEYSYFITLSKNMKNVEGADKDILVQRFFGEFDEENGPRFVCNQITSRMLDDLLPLADISSVQQICTILGLDLWTICTDPFASHVLQSVLIICLRLMQKGSTQKKYDDDDNLVIAPISDEEKQSLQDFIIKIGRYCNNNLSDFINDTYATHILRTLLEVLSGVEPSGRSKGNRQAKTTQRLRAESVQEIVVPPAFEEVLLMTADRLMKVANLPELLLSEYVSAVYQCALQVFKPHYTTTACQPLASHLLIHGLAQLPQYDSANYEPLPEHESANYEPLPQHTNTNGGSNECGGAEGVHVLFEGQSTTRLFESILECCSKEDLNNVYTKYFEGQMKALVQHKSANFAVQRLLAAWQDSETFVRVSDGVSEAAAAAVSARHMGVLLAWAQACQRLVAQQGQCFVAVMLALDCYSPEERQLVAAPALLYLAPHDAYQQLLAGNNFHQSSTLPAAVNLQGALLLQCFLNFNKPIKWVRSLLEMDTLHLSAILQDSRGCHVTDAFCNSLSVGEKSRMKLVCKLQNCAVSLACSKYGSRSLEALWEAATPPLRFAMCQQLADNANTVKASEFGAILYSKFNVRLFSRTDKQDWEQLEQKKAKKRRMLRELLLENGTDRPFKKKKVEESKD